MDKSEIVRRIEKFAPPEIAENWDCSGYIVQTRKSNISKAMLCLTVTDNVVKQAKEQDCDMIISHHPLFFVPFEYKDIDIYCAHTNLDCTKGGTTDVLIDNIFGKINKIYDGFLRYVDYEISVKDFLEKLRTISSNLRYVNNLGIKKLKRIAFCAGSGSEFIKEAQENKAEAFITGDLKFHTAVESKIVLFDIGHFESEIGVLKIFENLIKNDVDVIYAKESSPFII